MSGMSAFLSGATVGLAITMPIGPMSLLCIQRALGSGALAGFATGLGAATVLVLYTTCAILGLGPALAAAMKDSQVALSIMSAGLLLWLSARVLGRTISLAAPCTDSRGAVSSYCSAVACALFNPLTPVLLAAVLPVVAAPEPSAASTMIAGVFAASVGWWLIVSGGVAVLRARLSVTVLNLFNKASGLILGALGLLMAANAVQLRF
ncbi:LysE family translocator [Microvirga sp. 17 mud 1-3]|uniref:LysE family translocator n=1 Tax=Microvirga sp. 17 mud 1-3 TaxID=2082949 RepID=UPI000D6BD4EB|nr:LysE family transporter [Microvirga sp. 17 mud 1-3]AWM86933.1 permease [Microvirga sp. 17 mud 1-3]